jgi:DMSO reductase family type II enzyme heme b subunit
VELQWPCPQPVADIHQQTDLFADAAALMVPVVADAPWISMGERGKPVAAVLWRADRAGLYQLHAEGMGTMQRSEAPAAWSAQSQWSEGHYRLVFNIDAWAPLDQQRQLGIAIWRGSKSERGGLKSVSPGWIAA